MDQGVEFEMGGCWGGAGYGVGELEVVGGLRERCEFGDACGEEGCLHSELVSKEAMQMCLGGAVST